ncbi:hypothetical protein MKW98_023920 [Papaver atlanticum]|uniref:Uncharacterized protein n=1 Tax=Papaver atlanticum TaxID=357466 RepID=A0AAD4SZM7_9MAGN|nr:hypothetical protein MKW98_023920 [Papaver atlanticum]
MGMSFPHVLRLLCLVLLLSQVACRYSPPSPPCAPIRLSAPPAPAPPPPQGRFGDMPRRPPPPPPGRSSGRP